MKKLIVFLFLLIPVMGFSQRPFRGFFRPVTATLLKSEGLMLKDVQKTGEWLIRPSVNITAIQLNYDKQMKQIVSREFVSAGLGVGYNHFVLVDGVPFNNYGFNLLVLFGQEQPITPMRESSVSLAAVFNALGWVNVGPVVDLGSNKLGLLTGVSIKF